MQLDEFVDGEFDEETIRAIYEGECPQPKQDNSELFYSDEQFQSRKTVSSNNSYNDFIFDIVDDEVRPFAEDPSLQLLIQYQILEDQRQKALAEYQYDEKEFPSLVKDEKMREILREKTFKLTEWNKTKSSKGSGKGGDMLEEESIDKIKKAFPMLNSEIIRLTYDQLGDAQWTLEYLKTVYDQMYNENHGEVRKINIKPIKGKIPDPPAYNTDPKPVYFRQNNKKKNKKQYMRPFIENDMNYDVVREQEREYCRLMRHHYALANKAFQKGDGATARRESQKGKEYRAMYLNEKRQALVHTLATKNSKLNRNECIDLHGLHRNEVEIVLDDFIGTIKNKLDSGMLEHNRGNRGHMVIIITGKGNHSRGKPVVKNEVRAYLTDCNLGFKEADGGGYFTVCII